MKKLQSAIKYWEKYTLLIQNKKTKQNKTSKIERFIGVFQILWHFTTFNPNTWSASTDPLQALSPDPAFKQKLKNSPIEKQLQRN